jgi:hypothetical protein
MSLVDILGAPVEDERSSGQPTQHACRIPDYDYPEPVSERVKRSRLVTTLAVVAAVSLGVIGGWFGSRLMEPSPVAANTDQAQLPAGIAGYAELFVAEHLGSQRIEGDNEQPASVWVNQTAAIAGKQMGRQSWLVTVAVESLELVDSVYQPAELQHFAVTVTSVGDTPTAIGLPARVPVVTPPDQAGSLFPDPVPDDQAVAAITFIEEYLTGGESLNRYLAVPSNVARFESAPYQQVVAQPLGANSLGAVRMAVTATKSNGITHELGYVLTLVLAGDVWVVSSITPVAG